MKITTNVGTVYIGVLDCYLPEQQAVQIKRAGIVKAFHKWFNETWIAEGIIAKIEKPTASELVDYMKNGRDVHQTIGMIN